MFHDLREGSRGTLRNLWILALRSLAQVVRGPSQVSLRSQHQAQV
jgi:hypothetical protein